MIATVDPCFNPSRSTSAASNVISARCTAASAIALAAISPVMSVARSCCFLVINISFNRLIHWQHTRSSQSGIEHALQKAYSYGVRECVCVKCVLHNLEVHDPRVHKVCGKVRKTRRLCVEEPFTAICKLLFQQCLVKSQAYSTIVLVLHIPNVRALCF